MTTIDPTLIAGARASVAYNRERFGSTEMLTGVEALLDAIDPPKRKPRLHIVNAAGVDYGLADLILSIEPTDTVFTVTDDRAVWDHRNVDRGDLTLTEYAKAVSA